MPGIVRFNAEALGSGTPDSTKVLYGDLRWAAPGAGSGDVTAASAFANDNRLIRSDGTGKGVQASGITVSDADAISGGSWTGTAIAAPYGGTGQTAYTVGDLLYADTTTTLAKLAAGTSGYVLTSGGAGVAPSWAADAGVTLAQLRAKIRINANSGVTKDGGDLVSEWATNTVWDDFDFAQATATNQPLWVDAVINGQDVIRFDGVDNYMSLPISAVPFARVTVSAVIRPRDGTATEGILSWAGALTSASPFILCQRNTADVRWYVNGGYRFTVAHTTDATKLYVLTWDGVTWNLYVDGVAESPYTGAGSNQSTANQIFLGNGFNGYSYAEIADFGVWDKVLTSSERGDLETELMTLYGL